MKPSPVYGPRSPCRGPKMAPQTPVGGEDVVDIIIILSSNSRASSSRKCGFVSPGTDSVRAHSIFDCHPVFKRH